MNTVVQLPIHDPQTDAYKEALQQIKSSLPPNPLFQEAPKNGRDAAIILDRIVRFFYFENVDYLIEEKNFKKEILDALSEIFTFLSRSGIDGISEMYRNFAKFGEITDEMIYEKSKELFASIGKNNLPKFLEILFSPFGTLAGYRQTNIHGSTRVGEFSAYSRLLSGGLFYPEHRNTDIVRPGEGVPALTQLLPEGPTVNDVQKTVPNNVHYLLKGDLPDEILAPGMVLGATPPPETPGASDNPERVTQTEIITQKSPLTIVVPSDATLGKLRRRERDRDIRMEKEEMRERRKNQEQYDRELETFQSLSLFLHTRFEALRNHLLEDIPYVKEVIDYIGLREQLQISENKLETYSKGTKESRKKLEKADRGIQDIVDELPNLDEFGSKTKFKQLQRLQSKRIKNTLRIEEYDGDIPSFKKRIQEIRKSLSGYRFTEIPYQEAFSLAFHQSLRAEELFVVPEIIPNIPITKDWIEDNVIPLFVSILRKHLGEHDGVNILDLYELMGKIDELPAVYSEHVEFPHTAGVTQRKVNDFFEMLLPIIPRDHLAHIPSLPIIATSVGTSSLESATVAKPKQRKTREEKREDRRKGKELRIVLKQAEQRNYANIERELMEYQQFWQERIKSLMSAKRKIMHDINKLSPGNTGSTSLRGKNIEDLEGLKTINTHALGEAEKKLIEGCLKTDQKAYQKLIEERKIISKRLQRLK